MECCSSTEFTSDDLSAMINQNDQCKTDFATFPRHGVISCGRMNSERNKDPYVKILRIGQSRCCDMTNTWRKWPIRICLQVQLWRHRFYGGDCSYCVLVNCDTVQFCSWLSEFRRNWTVKQKKYVSKRFWYPPTRLHGVTTYNNTTRKATFSLCSKRTE
jgi:hypothetical protein